MRCCMSLRRLTSCLSASRQCVILQMVSHLDILFILSFVRLSFIFGSPMIIHLLMEMGERLVLSSIGFLCDMDIGFLNTFLFQKSFFVPLFDMKRHFCIPKRMTMTLLILSCIT